MPAWAGDTKGLDLGSQAVKQGYSIGYQLGLDFKAKGIDADTEAIAAGYKAAREGSEPVMKKDEMHTLLSDLQKKVETERREMFQKAAEENLKAGEKFLKENSAKEGVTTLPSGLQYKVLKTGDGPKPPSRSTGWCPDGPKPCN